MMGRRGLTYGILALLLAGACQDQPPVPTVADDLQLMGADQVTQGGRHIFTQEGIRSSVLTFDTAFQWRDSVNLHLRNLDLTVFNEDGSERARVTSERGTLDSRAERMTARRNVVLVVPGQDRRVETEELHYDPEGGRLWSDSAFVMLHQGRTHRGSAFTSDLEFQNFRIVGPGGG
jgi:LPS export ABC transporter protein LptC